MPESFDGLLLQFEAVDKKKDSVGVACAEEEFDDGGGGQRLAGAGGHFEEEAVVAFGHRLLDGVNRLELVRAQEAKIVGRDKARALCFIFPSSFDGVARPLGQNDVIFGNFFGGEFCGIRCRFLESNH